MGRRGGGRTKVSMHYYPKDDPSPIPVSTPDGLYGDIPAVVKRYGETNGMMVAGAAVLEVPH